MKALLIVQRLFNSPPLASSRIAHFLCSIQACTPSRSSSALTPCWSPIALNGRTVLRGVSHFPLVTEVHSALFKLSRTFTDAPQSVTEGEERLVQKLKQRFPKASEIQVHDISGGCGSMYEVYIATEEFRGLKTVLQHRLVNEALKTEIKDMHGLRISTAIPT